MKNRYKILDVQGFATVCEKSSAKLKAVGSAASRGSDDNAPNRKQQRQGTPDAVTSQGAPSRILPLAPSQPRHATELVPHLRHRAYCRWRRLNHGTRRNSSRTCSPHDEATHATDLRMPGMLAGIADVSGQSAPRVAIVCSPALPEARSSSASAATACHLDAAYTPSPDAGGEGSGQEATSAADPVCSETPCPSFCLPVLSGHELYFGCESFSLPDIVMVTRRMFRQ